MTYLDELSAYSDEEIGRITRAILTYWTTGEKTDFTGAEKYVMPHIYADQNRAMEKLAARRASAKTAAGSRWKRKDANACECMQTDADASDAMRTMPDKVKVKDKDNSPRGETPPLPPSRGKSKATQELPDADFEAFWAEYPKKKSKGEAKKAWSQLKPSREIISAIMAKLPVLKASHDWTKDGGQYVPNPATWLRAEGWEDVPTETPRKDGFATPAKPGEAPRVPSRARENAEWMRQILENGA